MEAWESQAHSFQALEEDDGGELVRSGHGQQRVRRQRMEHASRSVRRGLVRYVVLVVDASEALNDNDLHPSRLQVYRQAAKAFIREFFDRNPISQMGVVVTYGGKASKVIAISTSPQEQCARLDRELDAVEALEAAGAPSLQLSLELALALLQQTPTYGCREVLALWGSPGTTDPGDMGRTFGQLTELSVRCSVVGFGCEVYILSVLASRTHGVYTVATSERSLDELIMQHATPPPAAPGRQDDAAEAIRMGFPKFRADLPGLCVCHTGYTAAGYQCPQCMSKVCELPAGCPVCGLALVEARHLARSYHHLYPVAEYEEVDRSDGETLACCGCDKQVGEREVLLRCTKCKEPFCFDCDELVHEVLFNCPGCCTAHD